MVIDNTRHKSRAALVRASAAAQPDVSHSRRAASLLAVLPTTLERGRALLSRYSAQWLALAFVFYGLIAVAFLAINMPPFQNPDEPAHFLRAAQIADGRLLGTRFPRRDANGVEYITAGDEVDPAILAAAGGLAAAIHPDRHATRAGWPPPVHWSSARSLIAFPSTVVYPPFFYAPSALGVLVGRLSRMTVIQTLTLSRIMTGVASVLIGAVAIAYAGGAAPWLYGILTLPMSLALMASSAHDGLLLAWSALAGMISAHIMRGRNASGWTVGGLALSLGLVAMARPPYAGLVLLVLGLARLRWRWRILAALAVAVCVAGWSTIVATTSLLNIGKLLGEDADPVQQLLHLRTSPSLLISVATTTLSSYWHDYLISFIGQLGWLDTALPGDYISSAVVMLGVAAAATAIGSDGARVALSSWLLTGAGLLVSAAAIFGIEYLIWSAPGSPIVEGVQGRYFLPIALAGVGLLPTIRSRRIPWLHELLLVFLLLFPLVTLAVVMRAVVLRYYLA